MNKFAALDDDSDEEQETKPTVVKEKPVKAKKAAPEAPVAATPAPAPVTNGKTKEKEQNGTKKTGILTLCTYLGLVSNLSIFRRKCSKRKNKFEGS